MGKVNANAPEKYFPWTLLDAHPSTKEIEYWDMSITKDLVLYYQVPLNSDEGAKLQNIIKEKANGHYKSLKIFNIKRIQNPHLMATYLLNKESCIQEYGYNRVQSRLLLHGTCSKFIDSIATENFSFDKSHRQLYGKGIYFTSSIAFASKFCDKKYQKEVIVANVLQSMTFIGEQGMIVPPDGYDTGINKSPSNKNIISKYDDNMFYPAYRVKYSIEL